MVVWACCVDEAANCSCSRSAIRQPLWIVTSTNVTLYDTGGSSILSNGEITFPSLSTFQSDKQFPSARDLTSQWFKTGSALSLMTMCSEPLAMTVNERSG